MRKLVLSLLLIHFLTTSFSYNYFAKVATTPLFINYAVLENLDFIENTRYTFTPEAGECAVPLILDMRIFSDIDTTDMDRNTVWYSTSFIGDFDEGDCRVALTVTRVMRDTLIGDRLARIIGVTSGGTYYQESEIPFYEKDGKTYFYEDDGWWLLYDFTAKEGDTITYYISGKFPYYDIFTPVERTEKFIEEKRLIVVATDTIYNKEGQSVKRFHTVDYYGTDINNMGIITEHMGSEFHLFGMVLVPVPYGCKINTIRCFTEGDLSLVFTDKDCDDLSAVQDEHVSGALFYPNPVSDKLMIEWQGQMSGSGNFSIFNIQGVGMMSGGLNGENSTEIDVSLLPSGMYFVQVGQDSRPFFVRKFIKM